MRPFSLALFAVFAAAPALAQPTIIPLEPQSNQTTPRASAPPVAPPQAAATLPAQPGAPVVVENAPATETLAPAVVERAPASRASAPGVAAAPSTAVTTPAEPVPAAPR